MNFLLTKHHLLCRNLFKLELTSNTLFFVLYTPEKHIPYLLVVVIVEFSYKTKPYIPEIIITLHLQSLTYFKINYIRIQQNNIPHIPNVRTL